MKDFIERILEIYDKNFKDNPVNKQISKHWEIKNNKKFFNKTNLINFRGDPNLSFGCDDHNSSFTFDSYHKIISQLTEDYVFKNLLKENIGNSNYVRKYKNVYIDNHRLVVIYWFKILEKIIFNNNLENFCEIGGGYGCLSQIIIQNYNLKLLSIDLPHSNIITSYYLKSNFPNKKFFLYDDYLNKKMLSYKDFINNDIIILPPDIIIDEKIKLDLFINSRSMQEMKLSIIKEYFDLIQNKISKNGFFININRYEKIIGSEKIRMANYPYDKNWEVIFSKKILAHLDDSKSSMAKNYKSTQGVHMLITKRQFIKNKQNIINELKNIENLGKNFYIIPKEISPLIKFILKKFFPLRLIEIILRFCGNYFLILAKKFKNLLSEK